MARKNINSKIVQKKQQKNPISKRKTIKKNKKVSDEDQQNQSQQLSENNQGNNSSSKNSQQQSEKDPEDQDSNSSSQSDDDQDQQSQSQILPENFAIKQMQFRQRRGTKMNYLMNRKKQQQEDDFWKNQGHNYFGDVQNSEDDQEYQQSSSGRDQFDSDFDQTQSQHNDEEQIQEKANDYIDQQKQKQKKKRQQLMRKIGANKKIARKIIAIEKQANNQVQATNLQNLGNDKNIRINQEQQSKKNDINLNNVAQKAASPTKNFNKDQIQGANKYIHQAFTQQQLLGQAAQTQYINWLSLQKLISLQSEKKDFSKKNHFLHGQKIIYRNRIKQGKNQTTYQLVGVEINNVRDLTFMMNNCQQDEQIQAQERAVQQN